MTFVVMQEYTLNFKAEHVQLHVLLSINSICINAFCINVFCIHRSDSPLRLSHCLSAKLCTLMQEYIHKFEAEHVKLHMLLGIDHRGPEALGMRSYGHMLLGINPFRAHTAGATTFVLWFRSTFTSLRQST